VFIFYTDETGDAALTTTGAMPPELKAGHSNYFTLAGIGIRDNARARLAEGLLRLKLSHFGESDGNDWEAREIKGRYLRCAVAGRPGILPAGWAALDDPRALVDDLALMVRQFRPLVFTNVVDKRKMVARNDTLNPIGIAYSYLQRNIALTLEHQYAGENAVILADQQNEHEAFFRSGGIHEIRAVLERNLTRAPRYELVLDKPLWVDTGLSTWDREIIQLADIASFLVTRLFETGEPVAELQPMWDALLPQFALHPVSGRILGRGIAVYPARSSKLAL
jgi:hypothetical protein